MSGRRVDRPALVPMASGCAIVFAACVGHAQPQYVPPPTPLPPPIFNPSTPYTVTQPPYTPITRSTPSVAPGYVVDVPASERLPRPAARSRRRATAAESAAPVRPVRHRRHAIVIPATPPAYYYSAFGYGYGCAWRRGWDGYWFRTSPCF